MVFLVKRYRRKPADIEAAQVAEHTAQLIANWCGGSWGHERDRGVDSYLEIIVPNVEGNQKAHVNQYVVRKPNGRFYVMTEAEMRAEDYEEVGVRESGVKVIQPDMSEELKLTPKLTPHYVARGQHPFGN